VFWEGFFAGFTFCLALVIFDHMRVGFRSERRARADFVASLTPGDQKRFLSFESMGGKCTWRQFRELMEIEEARRLGEIGLRTRT
jgi:hypothetical protein